MTKKIFNPGPDLEFEKLYQFRGIEGPTRDGKTTWAFPPGVYRLKAVGRNYRTQQRLVIYVGTEGQDEGIYYLCCLSDWATQFTRLPDEQQEQPTQQADLPPPGNDQRSPSPESGSLPTQGA